jgi:hypothetical protein
MQSSNLVRVEHRKAVGELGASGKAEEFDFALCKFCSPQQVE